MYRCIQLARLGSGSVVPNPMVGAVLVHEGRIIGEGYHQEYGQAHAEVNCLSSVKEVDKKFIVHSTLFVSLEPCSHFGKTPPCADLIINNKIPHVVIGSRDPFPQVNGKGIEKLQAAGIKVELVSDQLETECRKLNKRFFCFHEKHRPYIILKWAQTADGFTSNQGSPRLDSVLEPAIQRLLISNAYSNRLVHKWRSEEAAILVGTNTALMDNPELTNRLWTGPSPTRLVLDMDLRLPPTLNVFNGGTPTIVFNGTKHTVEHGTTPGSLKQGAILYYKLEKEKDIVSQLVNAMSELKISSVFVEGGRTLQQSFIDKRTWDECRVITATGLEAREGQHAPGLSHAVKTEEYKMTSDKLEIYLHAAE